MWDAFDILIDDGFPQSLKMDFLSALKIKGTTAGKSVFKTLDEAQANLSRWTLSHTTSSL